MRIKRVSQVSGIERELEIDVTPEQMAAWEQGAFIQDAMPHLTPDEREFIMTGVTAEEWNEMFGTEEESEEMARLRTGPESDDYGSLS